MTISTLPPPINDVNDATSRDDDDAYRYIHPHDSSNMQQILKALTTRMEQLESSCSEETIPEFVDSASSLKEDVIYSPSWNDSMSTATTTSTLSLWSMDDDDEAGASERIAQLRKSKRAAEQEGTKKLRKSCTGLQKLWQENEAFKKQQRLWQFERQQYQQAIQDMSVLIKSLQNALVKTETGIDDAARGGIASTRVTPTATTNADSQLPLLGENNQSLGAEIHTESDTPLTADLALEMTLKHTKTTIERLDEECLAKEKSAQSIETELSMVIEGQKQDIVWQQDKIERLQETIQLQSVQIDTLRDIIMEKSQDDTMSTSRSSRISEVFAKLRHQ